MSKQKYTAHAMEFGYLYREVAAEGRILAGMYGEKPVQLEEESALGLMSFFEEEDEKNEVEELLANNNYLGRTTNFNELAQSGVGYSVGEPSGSSSYEEEENEEDKLLDDIFEIETLSWLDKEGNKVTELMQGEVRGLHQGPAASPNQNIEPLIVREAAELLDAINKTKHGEETDMALKASVHSLLMPSLRRLLHKLEDYEEAMYNHNWNLGKYITNSDGTMSAPEVKRVDKWAGLRGLFNKNKQMTNFEESKYLDYMMSRLKLTVRDNSLGGQWAHQDRYSMGARIGITDIIKELSVQNRTKQQQYTDDDFILLEKEILDREPLPKYILEKQGNQLFDKDGQNRGWGDKSRYFWRCSSDREQRFIKLQMYIMRAPLEDLKKFFDGSNSLIFKKYSKSIKRCAPGPDSMYKEGRYTSAPLIGQSAVDILVSKGFKKEVLHRNVKFHRGEEWHKIWLKKEHVQYLQQMVAKRIKKETVTLASKFQQNRDSNKAVDLLQAIVNGYKNNKKEVTYE